MVAKKKTGYNCKDYRQEMVLAGLRGRLQKEDLTEEERDAIVKEIRKLESAMGMD